MPIGLPRIPFRVPGNEKASWVDLYNGLYRTRSVFLGQEIDEEVGNQIAGLMVFLGLEDGKKDIYFFINSPGGLALPGLGIFDTMQYITPAVYTLGLGLVASMASFLLVGGESGKRIGASNLRVMLHQPASAYTGKNKAADVFLDSLEVQNIREAVVTGYAQKTGKPPEVINEDLERNLFLSATETKDYGIVDRLGFKGVLTDIRKDNPLNPPNPDEPDETPRIPRSLPREWPNVSKKQGMAKCLQKKGNGQMSPKKRKWKSKRLQKKGNVNASGKKRLISINRPAKAPNQKARRTGATERYVFRICIELIVYCNG